MEMKYGDTRIKFKFGHPPRVFQIKDPEPKITPGSFRRQLEKVVSGQCPDLSNPIVVVGDKTRLCGYPQYLPIVLDVLLQSGAKKDDISIIIAYGTHHRQSDAECDQAYGKAYKDFRFVHHDCTDLSCFTELAETSRGTRVLFRNELLKASFVLTFGAISHHYFAGYGGGRKLLFPGLGYKAAIYQNHSLFLDANTGKLATGCRMGKIEGNPLAKDLAEVEKHRPADLCIHGILNSQGKVCDLMIGKGPSVFRQACKAHGQSCEISCSTQFERVLASCGGFPKDINFIQAHKAIHNAASLVKDGGRLIILAECRDGIGSQTFLPWMEKGGYDKAFEQLTNGYEGNGGTALAMMEKLERIQISIVTEIDDKTSKIIGFEKISSSTAKKRIVDFQHEMAVIPNASLLVRVA